MANYIDKQVVNDALDKTCDLVCQYSKKQRYAMCGACPLGSAYDVIENVPSADVQPVRHGHWIEFDDAYNRISGRCSVCEWESHLYEDDVVGMPYCPNCGADMRGEQDG